MYLFIGDFIVYKETNPSVTNVDRLMDYEKLALYIGDNKIIRQSTIRGVISSKLVDDDIEIVKVLRYVHHLNSEQETTIVRNLDKLLAGSYQLSNLLETIKLIIKADDINTKFCTKLLDYYRQQIGVDIVPRKDKANLKDLAESPVIIQVM